MQKLTSIEQQKLLDLYAYMVASRESDVVEAELVNSGEANFLAASLGHEGAVILAPFLQPEDYLHCHYRDKALMLARGISNKMFFLSALCKKDAHSAGRQMVSHMSAPELNVLSLVGPVGNNALQAAGIAYIIKDKAQKPIVLCSLGDGTTQQGEVLEAIAESVRAQLPVLFFVHDNELAISTRTRGKTFFSLPDNTEPETFYGIKIVRIEGTRPFEAIDELGELIADMRANRSPKIVVFKVDRLANHSNADNQKLYRSTAEITHSFEHNDPIKSAKEFLLKQGVTEDTLAALEEKTKQEVRAAVEEARAAEEPEPCWEAEKPLPENLMPGAPENRGGFEEGARLTMLQAMREVLRNNLSNSDKIILLGEDLEDGKGDVFGMTRGLSTQFPGQVRNSALSESTIMGVSVGMALAGARPVAFLQFADFMPLAYNQLMAEAGSMYWRTNGGWECPVIVLAACGAYRPGLGPFHSQTNEATLAHIPGVDVFMPSNAADAAGMLNAAFQSGRPTVILYPKKLLNNGSVQDTVAPDVQHRLIPIGKARIVKPGQDITLVGWGNTVEICEQVSEALEVVGVDAEIVDLRTLKPYDLKTLLASVEKTGRIVVVHEDNHTCGLGGDVLASVVEYVKRPIKAKRITRSDTFVPCNFPNQLAVLPSFESVLSGCADLLDLELSFEREEMLDATTFNVEVIGASPSDESVSIVELYVKPGDYVRAGDKLVDTEASKSSGEILAPCSGVVEEIFVAEADQAKVGDYLCRIRLDKTISAAQQALRTKRKPILKRKAQQSTKKAEQTGHTYRVGISKPIFKTGSRRVSNAELLPQFPDKENEDIVRTTGIEHRYWLADHESIIDLAVSTVVEALKVNQVDLSEVSAIVCATTTPESFISPSMACLVLNKLYAVYGEHAIQAYDVNAACSGYLYALSQVKDHLQSRPHGKVIVVTAEALSRRLNQADFDTVFLFGDAATATIAYGEESIERSEVILDHFNLSALAEDGAILNVPVEKTETRAITLQGRKLFSFAVKNMAMALQKCCEQAGIALTDIALGVPHQANQRISDAVEKRLELPKGTFYSNIAHYGNTSSCTIPIALAETLPQLKKGDIVAMAAFGGGFTIGAGLMHKV